MHRPRRTIAAILILCAVIVGSGTIVQAFYYSPEAEQEVAIQPPLLFTADTQASTTIPTEISIPKISLHAAIEQVGITYAGNMGTPKFLRDAGWYKYGTLPGVDGSAVIDGHVDNGLGLPGVFYDLKLLTPGDDIYITEENGLLLHFKVMDVQTYYYTALPLQQIFTTQGHAYLNLITCEGTWLPDARTDDHRTVVFSELVE